MSCVTPWGEGSLKFVPNFLHISSHVPFSFANVASYLFVVINLSHEYDYMLSPVSLPCISVYLRGISGTLGTLIMHR